MSYSGVTPYALVHRQEVGIHLPYHGNTKWFLMQPSGLFTAVPITYSDGPFESIAACARAVRWELCFCSNTLP